MAGSETPLALLLLVALLVALPLIAFVAGRLRLQYTVVMVVVGLAVSVVPLERQRDRGLARTRRDVAAARAGLRGGLPSRRQRAASIVRRRRAARRSGCPRDRGGRGGRPERGDGSVARIGRSSSARSCRRRIRLPSWRRCASFAPRRGSSRSSMPRACSTTAPPSSCTPSRWARSSGDDQPVGGSRSHSSSGSSRAWPSGRRSASLIGLACGSDR